MAAVAPCLGSRFRPVLASFDKNERKSLSMNHLRAKSSSIKPNQAELSYFLNHKARHSSRVFGGHGRTAAPIRANMSSPDLHPLAMPQNGEGAIFEIDDLAGAAQGVKA
jgi:hypothetical protein